jgi:hypothetical protein
VASKKPKEPGASLIPLPLVIGVALFLLLGAGVWTYLRYLAGQQQAADLTAEAKAYVDNLPLSGVEMEASETFLGQTIVEINGRITNVGDRPLRQVDLNCVFYDVHGQVLLRQRVSIVRRRDGALDPGEARAFRLPFDELPAGWNQSMPQLVIAGISF